MIWPILIGCPLTNQDISQTQQPVYQQQSQQPQQPFQQIGQVQSAHQLPVANLHHVPYQTDISAFEQQQHDQFNKDMAVYTKMLEDRKIEQAAALDRQRQQLSQQMQEIQNRQNQVCSV